MSESNSINLDPTVERRIHRRRTVRLLLLAAIIFVCGGAVGWGGRMVWHRPPPMSEGFGQEPPVDGMVRQLREELLLSDDQAKKVHDIYQQREDALHSIRQKMEPELKAEYDKLDEQMKGVLNSAQYQRWSERFRNIRDRMLPPPPGHGGPGHGPMGGPMHGPGGAGGPDGRGGPDGHGGPGGPQGFGGPGDRPRPGPPDGMPPP